jgi:hypothetical protein
MQGSTVMRQSRAATLVTEEPYAFMAHVRVCGGGRLGNRWLYPEADRFQRRLTPSVRLPFRLGSCQSCWDGILYQHEAADCP